MEHIDIGVKRGACPRCRSNGKDRSGDNLALYPDGHSYCYSCGYWEISPLRKRIENKMTSSNVITIVKLPDDTTGYIPIEAAQWLRQYGITAQEVEKHKFMWSEKCKLLICPIFGADNTIIAWQGRNFKTKLIPVFGDLTDDPKDGKIQYGDRSELDGPKYFSKGQLGDILHIISPIKNVCDPTTIVIVEGVIDAIKVGRVFNCMPLFGSHMSLGTLRRLKARFITVGVWLDPDKTVEAVKTALRASQLMRSFVVVSTRDPKEYDINQIHDMVLYQSKTDIRPAIDKQT